MATSACVEDPPQGGAIGASSPPAPISQTDALGPGQPMSPTEPLSVAAASVAPPATPIDCRGRFVQGGVAVCRSEPGARVMVGEAKTRADQAGFFVIGFDRDAPAAEIVRVWGANGVPSEEELAVEPRSFDVSRIDGLPPSQVSEYTKAQLARIGASTERKKVGDASRAEISSFRDRFSWPLEGRRTTAFGAQRILNGILKRPHYGVDLAAPLGAAITSPADGVVTLADEDLYFEGAMIVIDHGQGLLSKYLHVSRIDVGVGESVRRGQLIGAVGSRGRSTGPHLCWRLKWRDRNLDPEMWIRE